MVEFSLYFQMKDIFTWFVSVDLFLWQFDAVENGMHTSKMMQVFSKQAPMMDALIAHFAEQMRRRKFENGQPSENVAEGSFIVTTLYQFKFDAPNN